MLQLTREAASLIRTLVDEARLSTEGGLRMMNDPVHHSLSMAMAPRHEDGDSQVSRDGAHLFLAPDVARQLAHQTLGAEVTAARSVFFLD